MTADRLLKILVVDDEPAIRELIVAVLEDEGYVAIGAHSGSKALELVVNEQPDLVLLDIMMPEMDGREAYRRIRLLPDAGRVPVVMMSAAYSADRTPQGVAGFLPKPFDLEHLLALIASALAHLHS
jgi:CheY-like chemotaxis protein